MFEFTVTHDDKSLSIINQSKILQLKDFKVLKSMKQELSHIFQNVQIYRTETEMKISVLNDLKFPTPDSKYWQSIREQNVMFQELVLLSYEYRKNNVEIKILQRDIKNEKDSLEKELIQIEIEKKQFISLNQERTAQDRIREIKEWSNIKNDLKPLMLGSFDNVNEHQLLSYTVMWLGQFLNMPKNIGIAEKNNLIGQLMSGLKTCKEKKCIYKVWQQFQNSENIEKINNLKRQLN